MSVCGGENYVREVIMSRRPIVLEMPNCMSPSAAATKKINANSFHQSSASNTASTARAQATIGEHVGPVFQDLKTRSRLASAKGARRSSVYGDGWHAGRVRMFCKLQGLRNTPNVA